MKKESNALPEGITQEQLNAFIAEHGEKNVKVALLPQDDDGTKHLAIVLKVPNRKAISDFEKFMDKNPDKAKELLINSCVLTDKTLIKADDELFFAAFDACVKLMPVRSAIIKNF